MGSFLKLCLPLARGDLAPKEFRLLEPLPPFVRDGIATVTAFEQGQRKSPNPDDRSGKPQRKGGGHATDRNVPRLRYAALKINCGGGARW